MAGRDNALEVGGDFVIDSSLEDEGDDAEALLAKWAKSNLFLEERAAAAISSSVEGGLLGGDTEGAGNSILGFIT
jgi:hypothetical protein